MAETPRPYKVTASGAAGAAPKGAVPIALYGAGSGVPSTVEWADVTAKPAVIAAGADQAAARTAIAAGTSSLAIGTTAVTAKAGNYVPTSAEVSTALKAKAQVAALAAVTAANASPSVAEPTKAEFDALVTLANANKAAINAIVAALKA